jgi:hypothetical protein
MRALIVALSVALVPAAASAQSWRPVARACAHAIDQQTKCGSCGGLWPYWALCTVRNVYGEAVPKDRLKECIGRVYAERQASHACNACGDPVADVMTCVGGA